MKNKIEKVAVLGAGTMGAQIAGHLANAGIPSCLFDISQELAENGVGMLTSLKPAPLYKPKNASLIEACNYDDHLEKIKDVDWIVEAVAENLDIKHKVYKNIAQYIKGSAIISSNTSGIPLGDLTQVMSDDLKSRFLITHFFNPPRYMRLLELVKGPDTADDIYNDMSIFGEDILGKGIVHAKDTPNFIGNRIGVHGGNNAIRLAIKMGLTCEEVDKLSGTIVGRPKSGVFRTTDIVGLDVHANVSATSYNNLPDDEAREVLKAPEILQLLIDSGRLGQKTKAGFYKKTDDGILSVDLKTGEYGPQKRVKFDGFRLAKDRQNVGERLKALAMSGDKAGKYFWEVTSDSLIYAANRLPEISDDIVNVDNAMKWGYGWELGPFEAWDAIGVENSVERMTSEGKAVPQWVSDMIESGQKTFHDFDSGKKTFFDFNSKSMEPQVLKNKSLNLITEKAKGNLVKNGWSASLVDIGDGVLCCEFHSILQSTLNPIDGSMIQTLVDGLDLVEAGKFKAMVVGHQGINFCAGANLNGIIQYCESNDYETIGARTKILQDVTQRMRFFESLIVTPPFRLEFGGGF